MVVYKKGRTFCIEKKLSPFLFFLFFLSFFFFFYFFFFCHLPNLFISGPEIMVPSCKILLLYCLREKKRVNPQPLYYVQIQSTRINTTFLFLIVSLQNWSILCNCDSCKYHVGSNFNITNTALTQCLVFISPFRKKKNSTHPCSW